MQEERAQQAKQEEQRLRAEMLAEMATQERLEQMSAQRARLRRAEHAREVERLLQAKRAAEAAAQVTQPFVIISDWRILYKRLLHPSSTLNPNFTIAFPVKIYYYKSPFPKL